MNASLRRATRLLTGTTTAGILIGTLAGAGPARAVEVPERDCGPYVADVENAQAKRDAAETRLLNARAAKHEAQDRYEAKPSRSTLQMRRQASRKARNARYDLQGKRATLRYFAPRLEQCQGPVGVQITNPRMFVTDGNSELILADTLNNMPVGPRFLKFVGSGDATPQLEDRPTFVDYDKDITNEGPGNDLLNTYQYDGLIYGTCARQNLQAETIAVEFWTNDNADPLDRTYPPAGELYTTTSFDNPCN